MKNPALYVLASALVCGCAVGPDYKRPEVDAPAQWRIEYPQAAEAANTKWWEQFGDPVLNQMIETALRQNLDVRAAAANVERFLGALSSTRSQFFPQFGYSGDASRNRASQVGPTPVPPGGTNYSLYQGALNASWQIDLFGRVRRQSEAVQAQVLASEQGRRGVVLSLVTSTASSYVQLRALDRQLDIARNTAKNYADTAQIFGLRRGGGTVSDVEVTQIESQYQQALATIPSLEFQVAVQENLLSVLLGQNPGAIPRGKTIDELVPPAIPVDLPSALLERRPDILQAEQNLVAANANIGATKSLYFPTISLTGLLGSVSTATSSFLTGPAKTWSAGIDLAGPLFTFGGISGQVDSAEAAQRQAVLFYQRTILNAFSETNNALVGSQKKREESEAQAKRVRALREYARLSRLRFDNGTTSYIEVLYAENELFTAELASVQSLADRYAQLIGVYQAVGGGWVDEADQLAPKPMDKPAPSSAAPKN